MTAHHKKTREAWDEPGHAHFVTYSCVQRLPLSQSIKGTQPAAANAEEL
jgi:hypothetical protein